MAYDIKNSVFTPLFLKSFGIRFANLIINATFYRPTFGITLSNYDDVRDVKIKSFYFQ